MLFHHIGRTFFPCWMLVAVSTWYAPSAQADAKKEATEILQATGVTGGFIVHLGVGNGELTAALKQSDGIQVQGLDRDAAVVLAARDKIKSLGGYGEVAVDRLSDEQLPYIDNFVNLLVAEDLGQISMQEVFRALVPNGVAYIKDANGAWKKTVKPRPKNIDEWSHYLHDASGNGVAHDEVVGPPRHLQWVGSPRWSRHHDRMASMSALVSTNGRMFYIMDEGSRISIQMPPKWKLIARDAFNGTVLWKRDIDSWQSHLWPLKSGPTQLSRRLVSTHDTVYVTLGYDAPLVAIDAATGKTKWTFEGTAATEEIISIGDKVFVVVRKGKAELAEYSPVNGTVGDQALAREMFWNEEPRVIMALDPATGKQLWAKQTKISPLTLAADRDNLYFHDGESLVATRQESGQMLWRTDPVTRRNQFTFNFGPRLVVHNDVVLYAGGDGKMFSFDSVSGKELWTSQHPNSGYQSPQDLMVMDGLVWCAPTTSGKDTGVFTGRDPRSGAVKKEFAPDVDTYWFHHRCYIAKATDKFLIPSRTGVEFVDPNQEHWDIHHWVRGGCLYGVMPCNGLTYTPPHDCACYPEAKLFGFNALAPIAPTRPIPAQVPEAGRLEKGPSYAGALSPPSAPDSGDWPTYRHDAARTGSASSAIPAGVASKWTVALQGRLTPPVISQAMVFVARVDAHTLFALDEKTGKEVWSYTIGGRIDSPPTIHRGRVVFGGADGWVYCLTAADGKLAWRYRAAPMDRRTMAFEQLESLWPVHGSVLVRDDVVHCVAGRSAFLDGGLRMLRLNLATGEKLSETLIDDKNPETGNNLQETVKVLQMPVGLPDILSADDKFIYMKSQKFDFQGNRLKIGPNAADFVGQASVQRGDGEHIFAPMGFLDESWFHRSYWVLGQSFAGGHGGYYQAGKYAPSGQILVQGNGYVFGYGRKPQYLRWTTTMEHQLFAADPTPPEIPAGAFQAAATPATYASFAKTPSLSPEGKPITVEAWVTATRPGGAIVARGGPAEGFALTLEEGRPVFMVRSDSQLATLIGPQSIIGGWHHVVGVLTADKQMRLYVDGNRVAEGKAKGLLTKDPAQGLEIGADAQSAVGEYNAPHQFTGLVDEMRLYFTAVDDGQVAARFNSGSEMSSDPVLVVTFDDGTARDFSTHRNNGTIEGATLVDGKFGKALQFSARNSATGGTGVVANNKAKNKNKGKAKNAPKNTDVANVNPGAIDSLVKPKWATDVPIYARAMVLAGNRLFIAGPLDMIDEERTFKLLASKDKDVEQILAKQDDALEGKIGGLLLSINGDTGEIESSVELGTLPTWDGMAGANGQVVLTTLDGRVMCFGKPTP